ncbi:MAG TPA: glycosyltransferase family 39 protein [Gaiellaceae bacterium]|nr:glycosyltransferase family 39 protein [Gaiellaceae bacterium]
MAFILLYAGIALVRMRYPYELEWMEGGMVAHVRRVLEGKPLYAPPSLDFVSFLYPPGYYLASAAVAWLTGAGFLPLRLLSFVSSLGVFSLLAALARKETGSWPDGVVAAGLFAATFARSGGWLDLARLDSFYMLVLLGAIFSLRHARFRGGEVLAGLLIAAAFFTKQSALVVVVPVLVWLFIVERRRAVRVLGVATVSIAAGMIVLERSSGGWFGYYCFTLPAHHPRLPGGWWMFWVRDLVPALPFALIGAVGAVVSRFRGQAPFPKETVPDPFLLPVLAGALVASSWSVRSVYGAEVNNLLPAFAGVSLLAATWIHGGRKLAATVLAAQLAWLAYSPSAFVPTAADRLAGDEIVRRLSAVPGEVFLPHHAYLARLAGKPEIAHTLAMDNVFLDDQGPARQRLEGEVRGALSQVRFGAAVIESDRRYESWIVRFYVPRLPLVDAPDVFWPVSGGRLRPERLALPPAR